MKKVELGTYVVSDPSICHGKLTFKGLKILCLRMEIMIASLSKALTFGHALFLSYTLLFWIG
jgi:hypothetical protein